MRNTIKLLVVIALFATPSANARSDYLATITPIIGSGSFQPTAISRDGSVVVGVFPAFRWQSGNAIQVLQAPPSYGDTYALGCTANGAVTVGYARSSTYGNTARTWDATGALVGALWLGIASRCSHDGQVIVGYGVRGQYSTGPSFAVRWTPTSGTQLLPTPAGTVVSSAVGVSGDGGLTVGWIQSPSADSRAVRWLGGENYLELWLPPGATGSAPTGVSDDGTVIIGYVTPPYNTPRGVRWSPDGGGEYFPAGDIRLAGINHDGTVVVGSTQGGNNVAVRWTAETGVVNLRQYLQSKGADVYGWTSLDQAMDVSADGKVIVGIGTFNGQQRGFVAFAPLECPGDLFVDGQVNGADLGVLLSQWGSVVPNIVSDINRDGVVNGADLGLLLSNWGLCP